MKRKIVEIDERRHGRLPAGVPCRCDQNRRARGRRIRRKGRAGAKGSKDAGTDEGRWNGVASRGTYAAARRLPRQGNAHVQPGYTHRGRVAVYCDRLGRNELHPSRVSVSTRPVAMPDSPGAGQGPVLSGSKAAHRRRLHGLRIRRVPSGVHARQGDDCRRENDVKSVTIVRMEVPCCGGLEMAAKKALQESGKFIPWQVVTISLDGRIIDS